MFTTYEQFLSAYTLHLIRHVKNNPNYAYTREHCKNIPALARRMVDGFLVTAASLEGDAIRDTCRELKIKCTYLAIRKFVDVYPSKIDDRTED